MKNKTSFISLLSLIAMLLLVLSSLTAILLDDGGDPYSFTTPRGEPIKIYGGNGPYQFDNTHKAIAFRSHSCCEIGKCGARGERIRIFSC